MLFYQPDILAGAHHLDEEESRHAAKVLRLTTGSEITVTDGKGHLVVATIAALHAKRCDLEIRATKSVARRPFEIGIAIAPTKHIDRTEWFVEKAVELGVEHIHFFHSRYSERRSINLERLQKKAVSAMKQSQQAWLPAITEIAPLSKLLTNPSADSKFIAHVDATNPLHLKQAAEPNKKYLVLIGPEGDFSSEELSAAMEAGFSKVSLGPNRLRTETAGVMACAILNLVNH